MHRLGHGWVPALAAALVVVGVVAGVQLATDDGGTAAGPVAGQPSASAVADAGETGAEVVAPVPTAGGSIAAAAQLFGTDGEAADVVRSSTVDLDASWPLRSCMAAAAPEAGRVDFVVGSERGPEYGRDLAIGWYTDAAVARTAYDGLLATLAGCAEESAARLATGPASLGTAASVLTVAPATTAEAGAEQSTYAVVLSGAVVVLASDHAVTFTDPTAPPVAFEGSAGQAERLLTEACRVDAGRCT